MSLTRIRPIQYNIGAEPITPMPLVDKFGPEESA